MPGVPSDDPVFIRSADLWLYKRPLALTENVMAGERRVAEGLRDDPMRGPQVARPLTSPRGPFPTKRTIRDVWLFSLVFLRRWLGWGDNQRLVEMWLRTNAVGLRRWSDENSVTVAQYVALHTDAIFQGRGRWLGQIIRSVPRPGRW